MVVFRSVRTAAVAGLALMICSGAARAADEEVVATTHAASLPSSATANAANSTADSQGPSGDAPAKAPTALSLVHGSAGVSIGTGGYRSAYVSAVMPVGDNGMLGLAVSQTDYGKNSGYGYGDYGYGGYGYGGYGRYGYGQRSGTSTSAAVMLDMSHHRDSASTPEGCAPGFRYGDHYIEPVWVTRLRRSDTCDSDGQH